MAAYSVVISLLQTLEQFQQRNSQIIRGQVAETFESLHATAEYFQQVLDEASCKSCRFHNPEKIKSLEEKITEKIKSLEEKIRVAASDAEDAVELEICQIMKGLSLECGAYLLPVVEKLDKTKKEVMEIVSDISMLTSTTIDDEILASGDSLIGTSSRSNIPVPNLDDGIVQGLDDDLEKIVERLKGQSKDLDIVTITGMGGIGKTTLARRAHDLLDFRYHFNIRLWLTISQEFRSRSVLLDALNSISKQTHTVNKADYNEKDDNELADLVQKNLKGPRYLVVVDDIWSTDVWDSIRGIFPDHNNRSRILLTTRETAVAIYANPTKPHVVNLLNVDNGWKLLRDKVFGPKHDHPHELEETGKKIVVKCQGLPLAITVIAGHLSKMARTLEIWTDVAQTLGEIVAIHSDKCLGLLGLSYHHLPNLLKPCFLSMGCFPKVGVEMWRLIQLWIAEGFIWTSESCKSLEEVAEGYLEDLISRNLIMVGKRRFNGDVKTCVMHDLLREFCLIEAEMTMFMHIHKRTHDLVPTLPTQKHNVRRLSFHPTEYDDCCKLISPVARSVYLTNRLLHSSRPLSNLKIPDVFSRFNLLRVLALFDDYKFPSFPHVITKFFHLRYLAIACNRNLPASISELQNLQTLIYVPRYGCEYFPGEIRMMKNLRHIHFGKAGYSRSLSPLRFHLTTNFMTGLPNLEELSVLSSACCTNELLCHTPNLKRLIIQKIRSNLLSTIPSNRKGNTNHVIDTSSLRKLEVLKCFNEYEAFLPSSRPMFVFATSLKRLTLSGSFLFTWEEISSRLLMLPNLEELKLKFYAVCGEVWRLSDEDKFQSLEYLLISEPLEFHRWEASSDSFPNLKRLVLKDCSDLKEIPSDFVEISTLESIELHNCAEDCAEKLKQDQEYMGNDSPKLYIY